MFDFKISFVKKITKYIVLSFNMHEKFRTLVPLFITFHGDLFRLLNSEYGYVKNNAYCEFSTHKFAVKLLLNEY